MLKKNRVEKTFAVSLSLHLLMFLAVSIHFPKAKKEAPIEIAFIETKPKKPKFKALKPPPPPQEPALVQPPPMKMITQESKPENEKEPQNAKYFAEHNQTVEKQTRAKKLSQIKEVKKVASRQPAQAPTIKTVAESDIALKKEPDNKPLEAPDDEGPAVSNEDKVIEDKGLVTLVNTKAFKYYAYCKRIKDKIQGLWEPQIKAKILKNMGKDRFMASLADEEKTTKAIIILDAQGALLGVQVIGTSGIEDMDSTAVDAFRAAAPFPNPPLGIIDPDGKIRIRWDFVLSDAN